MDYKTSGVDIEAGYKSVELMKKHIAKTMRPEVLGGIGGFSGAFSMEKFKDMEEPTLVSGTDGCGTKVKVAMVMDKHDTIGIDAVAMCVNDIACAGGEPLFFLDYIACGKNYPEKIAEIVKGVAEGCVQSEAALIGGETAEHPGLMPEDEYDLAGFAVGVVDKKDLLTGEAIPLVSDTHKSSDFVEFLTRLDAKYPEGDKIRLILDNHSAHTSQETQRYLNNHLGRFEFVFTPTHGFWLNLVEGFFSKLTKQMLQGIRVASKEELSERIYKYFDEINQIPIPYHGSYNLDSIDLVTEDIDQIVYEVVNAKAASEELSCKRAPKPIKRSPKKSAKTEN